MSPESRPTTRGADDWQRRYETADTPWDSGLVDPALRTLVDSSAVRPCEALEFGCGTGTNAVYLAGAGFRVTAIDYSPLAIEQARAKAAVAGVTVRWHVGDLATLDLPPASFEFLFDRGCYHCLRREGRLSDYQQAVKRLLKPGARVLLLAGNSDSPETGGPPKVSAAELCGDFERLCRIERLEAYHFQDAGGVEGPLAWQILMTRRE